MKQKDTQINNVTEPNSLPFNTNSYSETLLKNCGFPSNFFEQIDQNTKKYNSRFNQKIDKKRENSLLNSEFCKINKSLNHETFINNKTSINNCSTNQKNFSNSLLNSNIFDETEKVGKSKNSLNDSIESNNFYITSYKSKYKIKNKILYEQNSFDVKKRNKDKLFHKCCYPGCNRTFSSSGWLRTHYSEHLQVIHSSAYCRLFSKYLMSEKSILLNNMNQFYYSNANIYNNINNNINSNCQNLLNNNRNDSMNANNNYNIKENFFYPISSSCFDFRSFDFGSFSKNKYDENLKK